MRGLIALALVLCTATGALGRPLASVVDSAFEGRHLLAPSDLNLVLGLDASTAAAGDELTGMGSDPADAAWPATEDPAMSLRLFNAGYTSDAGGAVVFTAPPAGAAGSYGQSSELMAVSDGAWGSDFSAVLWYKGAQPADSNAVLLQVAYADESSGDLRPSATWRVGGFSDAAQGSRPLTGFTNAAPTWGALEDCWQQLAVVKSGRDLTFYRNKEAAGTATANFVVPDYGATTIGLGVDIASLAAAGSNGTAPTLDPAALASPELGWLSGQLGSVVVWNKALTPADIAGSHDDQAPRFGDALCKAAVPEQPEPTQPDPTQPGDVAEPPAGPVDPAQPTEPITPDVADPNAPQQPTTPDVPPTQPTQPTQPEPPVVPQPQQPSTPPSAESTLDEPTATVEGSGTEGRVVNRLQLTGGADMADLETNAAKQAELRRAIVNSLNVDPSYTEDNVELTVRKVERRRREDIIVREVYEYITVCEYVLKPTPVCTVEVLEQADINVYLFIRVEQPTMPWWKEDADGENEPSYCISDEEGQCRDKRPPVPVATKVNKKCSANICFLLDGSKSLINVDGWNDVVASARSIMYSMPDPATIFDVYWFSNDVQKIGTATGEEVARSNAFARKVTNTVPKAHGTFMAQAFGQCRDVLEGRTGPAKTIVMITDGKPTDGEDAFAAARAARRAGIKVVVVGAGEIDYDALKQLASSPADVFANFELTSAGLLKVADLASEGVCRELD